jgi:sulfite exporter TauE/SafE
MNIKDIFGNWANWMMLAASILIIASVWNIRFKNFKLLNLSFLSRPFEKLLKPLFNNPTSWRGVLLGMALGLLPCGLLYAALAAAAASASATAGATLLLAFALGTVPSLLVVTFLGRVAASSLKNGFRFFHKGAGTITACWLAAFAVINMQ